MDENPPCFICEVYMDWIGMNLDMPVLKDSVKYMKEIHAQKYGNVNNVKQF